MAHAVTEETVRMWRKELEQLRDEDVRRRAKITELEKKLDAAAVLGFGDSAASDKAPSAGVEGRAEDAASLPSLILEVLRNAPHPMRPPQIKVALVEGGLDAKKFGSNGSYFYTVLNRLAKTKKITKKRQAYLITPENEKAADPMS